MSYRGIKRILGETSLECKCRFLFGGGLMLLITVSFYSYAKLNLRLVREQTRERARLLVAPNLLAHHAGKSEQDPKYLLMFQDLRALAEPTGDDSKSGHRFALYKPDPTHEEVVASHRPQNVEGYEAINDIRRMHASKEEFQEVDYENRDGEQPVYSYYGAVLARQTCIECHSDPHLFPEIIGQPDRRVGDLLGVAHITFPLEVANRDIAQNNAILIAMAIVTAFMAMLAAYAIVRYVIVKPVLHLKEVSDSIAHGDLDQRADIRTGDEFEELSHAFNRMLRHLLTLQDELRQVNTNLDGKVDELAQANLSLHEMNKLKSEFLATMSHELRTPLNSILGFSELLAGAENIDDRQRRYLKNIETSGHSLLSLIDDILQLAKIEAGKMDLHLQRFSLEELMDRSVASIRPLAERRNIELKWEPDPDVPIVRQDAGKLQQILYNLLSNAVKFTPEGGRILVRAVRHGDDQVDLIVADNGIGIPLEDQATIFEKFRQGRTVPGEADALTREYEGTGLGLSIVKELTRLLGGEVLLESEFGKGSTFTVRVPCELQPSFESSDVTPSQQTVEFRRRLSGTAAAGALPADRVDSSRSAPCAMPAECPKLP